MDEVRALTVRRPWADLIARGSKPVENRGWTTGYRGRLLIHAGRGWEPTARWFAAELVAVGSTYWRQERHPEGVVAVARLAGVCPGTPCDCGPWAADRQKHWRLTDVQALCEPVPARGKLGLWRPDPDVLAAVTQQLGAGVR